ncbi:MAG: sulfate permease [Rikenellaceae bacterium]
MKNRLSGLFQPKLFELFKKGNYSKELFTSDLIAGIIVGIVALPLAIAFGIASGVTPQQGLITAVVAGFLVSFFGGSHFLIGGPTGAFIVIVYGIVAQYGMSGLIIATFLAGIILVLMGVLKIGGIIKFIPYPIVVGFTSGIAVVIFSTQIKDFFGLSIESVPSEFISQWGVYLTHFNTINITETVLSAACLLMIIFWPKVSRKIPGSLIAIIVGTLAAVALREFAGIEVATIGTKFPELAGGITMPKPQLPELSISTIQALIKPAFTIALLCAIESLLAAMVADGVTGKKHNSNTELIGQGIANIVTPFFGGIPATGAIARTMTSINNGGKTPVTGIIHAVVLLLIFLFLMPYAVYIPLSCLAAILIIVAYNMSEWRTFKYLLKGDTTDVIILLITFSLTVIIDLTIAIEVGIGLAFLLFVRRISETSSITISTDENIANTESDELAMLANIEQIDIPKGVEVYEIDGPFFFGLASKLDEVDRDLGKRNNKIRIIRMRKVPFMDSTGLHNLRSLVKRSQKEGIQIILSGVTQNVHNYFKKAGFDKEVGEEFIFSHISKALKKAQELTK